MNLEKSGHRWSWSSEIDSSVLTGENEIRNAPTSFTLLLSQTKVVRVELNRLPITPGNSYRFAANITSKLIYGAARLELAIFSNDGQRIVSVESEPITSITTSHPVFVDAFAPSGATSASIAIVVDKGSRGDSQGSIVAKNFEFHNIAMFELFSSSGLPVVTEGDKFTVKIVLKGNVSDPVIAYEIADLYGRELVRKQVRDVSDVDISDAVREPGYYLIRTTVKGSNVSESSSEISFGVISSDEGNSPKRAMGLDTGMSWYSGGDETEIRKSINMIAVAGVTDIRDRISWNDVYDKRNGRFNWKQYKTVADIARQNGIGVTQVWHDTLRDELELGRDQRNLQRYPPNDPLTVYAFINEMARNFGNSLSAIEIWNEANAHFFLGQAEEYVAMLKAASLGASAANPKLKILPSSVAGEPDTFFEDVFLNNASDYVDGINFHYGGGIKFFEYMSKVVFPFERKVEIINTPVYVTEMSEPLKTAADGRLRESELRQLTHLIESYATMYANNVTIPFYFVYKDFLEFGDRRYGIVRRDLSPRPAFLGLANVVKKLARRTYFGRTSYDGIQLMVYRKGSQQYDVLAWANDERKLKMNFRGAIYNGVGQMIVKSSRASSVSEISIGNVPLFIEDVDIKNIGRLDSQPNVSSDKGMHVGNAPLIWVDLRRDDPGRREHDLREIQLEKRVGKKLNHGDVEKFTARIHNYSSELQDIELFCSSDSGVQLAREYVSKFRIASMKFEQLRLSASVVGKRGDVGFVRCKIESANQSDHASIRYHIN